MAKPLTDEQIRVLRLLAGIGAEWTNIELNARTTKRTASRLKALGLADTWRDKWGDLNARQTLEGARLLRELDA